MEKTTPIADRYEPLTLLGRGGGGVVWRARDQLTGEVVALKVLRGLDAAGQRRLRRELAALRWHRALMICIVP